MTMGNYNPRFSFPSFLPLLSAFICAHLWILPPSAFAQGASDQEIAVNLAEGRVVVCATKDAIILAAMGAHGEAGSRPPDITILSAERMAVMLGAVEWVPHEGLIDEVRLIYNPIILGNGMPIFKGTQKPVALNLYKSRTFRNGNVLHYYRVGEAR